MVFAALGAWQTDPAPVELAFGVGDSDDSESAAVWRADLPRNLDVADAELARREASLRAAQGALDEAARQVARLAGRTGLNEVAGISFGSCAPGANEAGNDLQGMLLEAGFFEPAFSFGLIDEAQKSGLDAVPQIARFFETVQGMVVRLARVETYQDSRCVGKTMIHPKGDLTTAWDAKSNPETQALHLRSLEQALASRAALIRTAVTLIQGAGTLAALAGSPGGAILALPVLWKYVNRLINQVS